MSLSFGSPSSSRSTSAIASPQTSRHWAAERPALPVNLMMYRSEEPKSSVSSNVSHSCPWKIFPSKTTPGISSVTVCLSSVLTTLSEAGSLLDWNTVVPDTSSSSVLTNGSSTTSPMNPSSSSSCGSPGNRRRQIAVPPTAVVGCTLIYV